MPCNKPKDCAPCQDCPPTPESVEPRCNNDLTDGVFSNATVTITEGCITLVEDGEPFESTTFPCGGIGGGEQGPIGPPGAAGADGPPGPPGPPNHLTVGTTHKIACGQDAQVTINGTSPNQYLTFWIPDCSAAASSGGGVTDHRGGISFENGLLTDIGGSHWPPVMNVMTTSVTGPIQLSVTKDPSSGVTTINIAGDIQQTLDDAVEAKYAQLVQELMSDTITPMQDEITNLQQKITLIELELADCCP